MENTAFHILPCKEGFYECDLKMLERLQKKTGLAWKTELFLMRKWFFEHPQAVRSKAALGDFISRWFERAGREPEIAALKRDEASREILSYSMSAYKKRKNKK